MAAAVGEVLVVVTSATRRGAELEGTALAEQLVAHGVDASAVALAPGSEELEVPVLGAQPLAPSTLRALRRRARRARIVVAYGSSALPASAIGLIGSGIPFVYRSIGDPAAWVRGRVHRARTGLVMRRSARVVVLWPGAADSITRLYGVASSRITVIPNARDHRAFMAPSTAERRAARAVLGLGESALAVVAIGALTAEKRVGLAVDAVTRVPGAVLLVVGDGPEWPSLQQRAASSAGRVRLLGHQDDVRPILHAADLILSTSSTEGMPGALIEAAMCGVPAVATDVGAVRAVIGDGGVVLPPTAAAGGIADAIAAVASRSDELADVAVEQARTKFSWDRVLPSWLEILAAVDG